MNPSSTISSITNLQQLISSQNDSNNIQSLILSKTIPTLSSKSHKGSSRRITILGGSAKYTGAPYYAAMSALRTGSDLVTVYCANEATLLIKSYSPELMVEGVYSTKEFDELTSTSASASASASELAIDTGDDGDDGDDDVENSINGRVDEMVQKVVENLGRMHSIIIRPHDLSRCPLVLKATAMIIQNAMKKI